MVDLWALLVAGVVVEVTDIDPEGRFHPDMVWLACGAEVAPGWTYDGARFRAP